jgi:predicted RND superfamily exporter protein
LKHSPVIKHQVSQTIEKSLLVRLFIAGWILIVSAFYYLQFKSVLIVLLNRVSEIIS